MIRDVLKDLSLLGNTCRWALFILAHRTQYFHDLQTLGRLPVGDVVVACVAAVMACRSSMKQVAVFGPKHPRWMYRISLKWLASDGSGLMASLVGISACRPLLGNKHRACTA